MVATSMLKNIFILVRNLDPGKLSDYLTVQWFQLNWYPSAMCKATLARKAPTIAGEGRADRPRLIRRLPLGEFFSCFFFCVVKVISRPDQYNIILTTWTPAEIASFISFNIQISYDFVIIRLILEFLIVIALWTIWCIIKGRCPFR